MPHTAPLSHTRNLLTNKPCSMVQAKTLLQTDVLYLSNYYETFDTKMLGYPFEITKQTRSQLRCRCLRFPYFRLDYLAIKFSRSTPSWSSVNPFDNNASGRYYRHSQTDPYAVPIWQEEDVTNPFAVPIRRETATKPDELMR